MNRRQQRKRRRSQGGTVLQVKSGAWWLTVNLKGKPMSQSVGERGLVLRSSLLSVISLLVFAAALFVRDFLQWVFYKARCKTARAIINEHARKVV